MSSATTLRRPVSEDGPAVHTLIAQCPPLDTNSVYCNLLQCEHFSATSVLAENDNGIVGFISGYRRPDQPQTLFIWQVAVSAAGRGEGLAKRMLNEIIQRPECVGVQHLETTITPGNTASWRLFESLARDHDAILERSPMFDSETHFGGEHDTEQLARISPLKHAGQS